MTIALNISGDSPNQISQFTIEGVNYFFQTRWNTRMGWTISIYDSNSNPSTDPSITPLLGGLKCMSNGLLTWRYSREGGLFSGDIMILDTEGEFNGEITRDNFGEGRRYVPVYFTEEELVEFNISSITSYAAF